MTSEEAMGGRGQALTFNQAKYELENHGMEWREAKAGYIEARACSDEPWERLRLNTKTILEWLGY